MAASLERAGLQPSLVQEVLMGNVISTGLGQVSFVAVLCQKHFSAKKAILSGLNDRSLDLNTGVASLLGIMCIHLHVTVILEP